VSLVIVFFFILSLLFFRIAEGTAREVDIHASVSEQIKKNFYKAKWKVSIKFRIMQGWKYFFIIHKTYVLSNVAFGRTFYKLDRT